MQQQPLHRTHITAFRDKVYEFMNPLKVFRLKKWFSKWKVQELHQIISDIKSHLSQVRVFNIKHKHLSFESKENVIMFTGLERPSPGKKIFHELSSLAIFYRNSDFCSYGKQERPNLPQFCFIDTSQTSESGEPFVDQWLWVIIYKLSLDQGSGQLILWYALRYICIMRDPIRSDSRLKASIPHLYWPDRHTGQYTILKRIYKEANISSMLLSIFQALPSFSTSFIPPPLPELAIRIKVNWNM